MKPPPVFPDFAAFPPPFEYQIFLVHLHKTRRNAGLSQRDLAARLDVSLDYVRACERGEHLINVVEVRAWCRALDIALADFSRTVDEAIETAWREVQEAVQKREAESQGKEAEPREGDV